MAGTSASYGTLLPTLRDAYSSTVGYAVDDLSADEETMLQGLALTASRWDYPQTFLRCIRDVADSMADQIDAEDAADARAREGAR